MRTAHAQFTTLNRPHQILCATAKPRPPGSAMPLVLLCGLPSSGKTRRAEELVEFLRQKFPDKEVQLVKDDFSTIAKNACYASSRDEKIARGQLKSSVERHLSPDAFVILDSLNYIKGFRYELFCVSKHLKSTQCVLLCDTPSETAKDWNSKREEDEKYSDEIFDALVMRFEPPDSQNRWDHPLFTLYPDDPLPTQAILDTLMHRKPPPPNQSTQSQPLSATNFLHELDQRTQEVLTSLLDSQRTSVVGEHVAVPGTTEKVHLTKNFTMAELRRLRRQFITYTKLHPVDNHDRIPTLFVQFLNTSV